MARSGFSDDLGGPRPRARRPSVGSRAIARQIRPRDRAPKTGLGPFGLRPLPRHPATMSTLPLDWCPARARLYPYNLSHVAVARFARNHSIFRPRITKGSARLLVRRMHAGRPRHSRLSCRRYGRLPFGSSRVRDSHVPPINVRRCGRRGLRGNPPSAGPPLRCGPWRDARVAWDASGL